VEDDRGRNALFVLCEQMCLIASDVCPDAPRLMHIVLDACGASGVGGSDRTGRTVFDIEERVPHSCLSACRQILLDSANTHRVIPLRHSKPPAQVHYPSGGRSIGSASSVTSEWELERPKPSGSLVASRYASTSGVDSKRKISNASYASSDNYSARNGVAHIQHQQFQHEAHGREEHGQFRHSSSVQDQHRKRPASASSQTSSYFEDDDHDDDSSMQSGGYGRSGGSLRGGGHHQH
jgi:hypothetical protein